MFLFLASCSAWHLLRTLFLMPRTYIPYPLPPDYDYGYGGLAAPCWGSGERGGWVPPCGQWVLSPGRVQPHQVDAG